MKRLKLIVLSLGLVVLSGFLFVGVVSAQSVKTGDNISVAADETVDSILFAGGKSIDIAGTVNGDLYCAGQNVNISGIVKGDVFCAGQTITVSGLVEGSVRLAAQTVTISGIVNNSATIGTPVLLIEKDGIIGRDLLGGSENTTVNGQIKRDFVAGAQNLTINGTVGRNIKGGIESITIGTHGLVAGTVEYTGNNDPIINNGGKISGAVTRTAPKNNTNEGSATTLSTRFGWFVYLYVALVLSGLILTILFPKLFIKSTTDTVKSPGMAALVGAVSLILTPFVILFLFMSFVFIPLAFVLLLTWITIILLSGSFTSYLLGSLILKKYTQKPVWIMLAGSSALVISFFIPFIGFITFLASLIFGTGMILLQSRQLLARPRTKK